VKLLLKLNSIPLSTQQAGRDSADAKRYQEEDVSLAIAEVARATALEEENELNEDEV
jgi:hypothetical protein